MSAPERPVTALGRLKIQSVRLRAAVLLAGLIAFAAHLAVTLARTESLDPTVTLIDVALAVLLLAAAYAHLRGLIHERQQHVMATLLLELTMEPERIHETAGHALALIADSGLAEAGVLAIARGGEWLPVAAYAYPDGWIDDAPRVRREPAIDSSRPLRDPATHPWGPPVIAALGQRPTVTLVPVGMPDDPIGMLLLAARRHGALRHPATLALTGRAVGAALHHAEIYEAASERERALEAQSQRHREVLAALADELRAPLSAIAGLAELAVTATTAHGRRGQLLAALARSAERLQQLLNELLREDGEDTAALHPVPELIDLADAVHLAEAVLRPAFMLGEQSLTLELPREPVRAYADPGHVEQIALNMLSNANRRTPMGGHVHVRVRAPDDRTTLIEFEDSGPPIAGHDRARIFEGTRGARLPAADDDIGLEVARHLARLQDGRVWAEETAAGGVRFCVALPGPAVAPLRAPVGG